MKITIERNASHAETAAEMDRRGKVIVDLEDKIYRLKKQVQYAYNDGFKQGRNDAISNGSGVKWENSVWKRDLDT